MPSENTSLSRRKFLSSSATAAGALTVSAPTLHSATRGAPEFSSKWSSDPDRVWLGAEYWANPLQDWKVRGGRIECDNAAADRNVHVLTRQLAERDGTLDMFVTVGRSDGGAFKSGKGSVGFRIGVSGPLREYRNSLIFGKGIDAGITSDGAMFVGGIASAKAGAATLGDQKQLRLRLSATPAGRTYIVKLSALDPQGNELGSVASPNVPADQLVGNLALVCNFGAAAAAAGGKARAEKKGKAAAGANPGMGTFWFSDWKISGDKVDAHGGQTFGPILFSQYTLHDNILKLTAQMPPLGAQDSPFVDLQFKGKDGWATVHQTTIAKDSWIAAFRIPQWDSKKDAPYRLAYQLKNADGTSTEHYWTGTIRRDPVDKSSLSVADISCNIHSAFPNPRYTASMAKLNPDFLAFTGDQFYESTGGYGVQREPLDKAMLDYLRKWYMHGWTWRELMRDRPGVSLPDDHDVYQGNLWGEGGEGRKTTQEAGGYDMPAAWVNMVYSTQTSHHPDPHEPTPGKRGTINWYGPLTYGRISFAVLADRQYKSGPEGKIPPTDTKRGDHVMNPKFDPRTSDVPGLELLGKEQEAFLRDWAGDWRGAEMKAVISQTIFTAMATTHGGSEGILRADHDTNGWPQTARNRAVAEMRRAFAFHIAGDQHLPAVIHYGLETHRAGGVAFAGPAVNVGYPRWWEPARAQWTHPKGDGLTGDFVDNFGHPLTVIAVKNGEKQPRQGDVMQFLQDKASGLGVVTFNKRERTIRMDCWPFLADVTRESEQFPGWPVTVKQMDNYGFKRGGWLPTLKISGVESPVVQVFEDKTDELLYNLRIRGREFQPHVFEAGKYTVKVGDPESGKWTTVPGLDAARTNSATINVRIG